MSVANVVAVLASMKISTSSPITLTNTGNNTQTETLSTSTFTSQAIGTATATRYVIVVASARGSAGGSRTITGLTIGGVSATSLTASASSPNPTAIFGLLVTSGTTATVVVTASGTMSRAGISIYTIENYSSTTPTDSGNAIATSTSRNIGVNVSAGGCAIYGVSTSAVTGVSWTNATEDYDNTPGTSFEHSAASFTTSSAVSPNTATASWTGSNDCSICAVSFR